jgi:hypothetical protein
VVNTICFAKKPTNGGKPTKENKVITKNKASMGLIEK